jgi:hypothetical protein
MPLKLLICVLLGLFTYQNTKADVTKNSSTLAISDPFMRRAKLRRGDSVSKYIQNKLDELMINPPMPSAIIR